MANVIWPLALVLLLANASFADTFTENANAKISLKVFDEAGLPIENASVGVGFIELLWWDSKSTGLRGTSDSEGMFSASHDSSHSVGYRAEKNGYYQTLGNYNFNKIVDNRWEPWDPVVTVVLRKKENPVPMYAMDTKYPPNQKYMIIPVLGKEVGFDLMQYDWMPPYGKGKTTDFILKAERTFVDYRNFDAALTITFPNAFDGILLHREDRTYGSVFKLPRFAPDSGYTTKLVVKSTMVPKKGLISNSDENNNYFFRVRSEEKGGKLVRAMYGKIQGDVQIDPRGNDSVVIVMKYFLNPDYTRNMEFSRNLFKGQNVGMN